VFTTDRGRAGRWLMPDNKNPGILEDFLATLVPDGDPCWTHAREATAEARRIGAPLLEQHSAKGHLYAWLAWQDPPGMPFGTALTAKCLSHESPVARDFVAWFKRVFG